MANDARKKSTRAHLQPFVRNGKKKRFDAGDLKQSQGLQRITKIVALNFLKERRPLTLLFPDDGAGTPSLHRCGRSRIKPLSAIPPQILALSDDMSLTTVRVLPVSNTCYDGMQTVRKTVGGETDRMHINYG